MDASQPEQVAGFSINRFKQLYQPFDETSMARLDQVYSDEVIFKDPIHQLRGLRELRAYFQSFCSPGMHCEFEFIDQLFDTRQAFFHWRMHYRHPKIKAGTPQILNGATLIKYEDKVNYHEDFYDMGAMIYQHIPLLGFVVKTLNAHLANAHWEASKS